MGTGFRLVANKTAQVQNSNLFLFFSSPLHFLSSQTGFRFREIPKKKKKNSPLERRGDHGVGDADEGELRFERLSELRR